jgi:hypothetical protein
MHSFEFAHGLFKWLHAMIYSPFAALINLLMVAGCVVIARDYGWGAYLGGALHGLAHGVAVYTLYWLGSQAAFDLAGSAHPVLSAFVVAGVVLALGTLVGGFLFGLYLGVVSWCFGHLTNNAFGALGCEDFKGFLRCTVHPRGLTLRFLAVDRVPRRWKGTTGDPPARWRVIESTEIDLTSVQEEMKEQMQSE